MNPARDFRQRAAQAILPERGIAMTRSEMLRRLESHPHAWDMIVVGGGATGRGRCHRCRRAWLRCIAPRTKRLRQRYLQPQHQARPRRRALSGARQHRPGHGSAQGARPPSAKRAPHRARPRVRRPNYDWWEASFYGLGLKLYQLLAGKYGFGTSRILSKEETLEHLPTLKQEGLRGGAVYYDGQFDDAGC